MRCGSFSVSVTGWFLPHVLPCKRTAVSQQDGQLRLSAIVATGGGTRELDGHGNGLLSAAASGLSRWLDTPFVVGLS